MVAEEFIHRKHINLVLLEDGVQLFVAQDLSLIAGILQAVSLDVVPDFLDYLWTGELQVIQLAGQV